MMMKSRRVSEKKFAKDENAVSTSMIIGIAVSLLLAGIFLPIGIDAVEDADTTNWSASTVTVFVLLPLAAVLAIVLAYFRASGFGGGGAS